MLRVLNAVEPRVSGGISHTSFGASLWGLGPLQVAVSACGWAAHSTAAQSTLQAEARGDQQEAQDESTSYSSGPDAQSLVQQIARQSHVAEVSAASFFKMHAKAGSCLTGRRLDLEYFKEQEMQLLQKTKEHLILQKARPSALQGLLGAAGLALGTLAGLAPRNVNLAITGAVQDALTDHFTDQIRRLHASGAGGEGAGNDARELLRGLRDAERAPDGAPRAPDLLALSKMRGISDLGVEGAVGAVVKAGTLAALNLTARF